MHIGVKFIITRLNFQLHALVIYGFLYLSLFVSMCLSSKYLINNA